MSWNLKCLCGKQLTWRHYPGDTAGHPLENSPEIPHYFHFCRHFRRVRQKYWYRWGRLRPNQILTQKNQITECLNEFPHRKSHVTYHWRVHFPLETAPDWDLVGFSTAKFSTLAKYPPSHHPETRALAMTTCAWALCACLYLLSPCAAAIEAALFVPCCSNLRKIHSDIKYQSWSEIFENKCKGDKWKSNAKSVSIPWNRNWMTIVGLSWCADTD